MKLIRLLSIAFLIVLFLAVPQASAEGPFNDLARFLGWGWSNGRHANSYSYGGWVESQPTYPSGWQTLPQPATFPAETIETQGATSAYQTGLTASTLMNGGIPMVHHPAMKKGDRQSHSARLPGVSTLAREPVPLFHGPYYSQRRPYYRAVPARR